MRVEDYLRRSAAHSGSKTALVTGDKSLTYAELDLLSDRLAAALVDRGVREGDRVLIMAENCSEAIIALFGSWKSGAVPCPVYASIKTAKLQKIVEAIQPSALFVQSNLISVAKPAVDMMERQPYCISIGARPDEDEKAWIRFQRLVDESDLSFPRRQTDGAALALLIHTSGSTGTPKGVMHSHASLLAACGAITSYLENTADDIVYSVLPISFGYGLTQVITMVMAGGTLVLDRSFAFPRKALARMAEVKATGFPLVPAMAVLIAGMQDLETGFLPDLRYITSAAAAMPTSASKRLAGLLPDTKLFLMYGQTECIRSTFLAAEEAGRRPLSVGKAIPGTTSFVVDESGKAASAGNIGELVVEGAHVMLGYWQDTPATSEKITSMGATRRLYTGDLFKTDEDGFLYFVSRRDDIIKTRGEKVSPQEVEQVLYALAGIREAAVVGIDHPVFGQLIHAYVALEPDIQMTEKDILRHCALHLEDYMVPKSVEFRDALPRTSTGKIRMTAEQASDEGRKNAQ